MIKKILKWVGIVLLTPIILFIILFTLLYIPPIQNYLRGIATEYASKATGMNIGIERISLSFPLDLVVKGVDVVQEKDTLLSLKQLTVKVQMLPLLRKDVQVDGIELKDVMVNSMNLVEGMKVQGSLGDLFIESHGINLGKEEAVINKVSLADADIKLCLNDTTETPKDSTSTPIAWKVMLHTLQLKNVSFDLQMPADSLGLVAVIGQANVDDGFVDLGKELYSLGSFKIKNGAVRYNSGQGTPMKGLDPSHIALNNIQIGIDSLKYHGKEMGAIIHTFSLDERSGLSVTSLTGTLRSDSTSIYIPDLQLRTPDSYLNLTATADWSSLGEPSSGAFRIKLKSDIGKQDVLLAAGDLPETFAKEYPFRPLVLRADVEGNISRIAIKEVRAELPGAFRLQAQGNADALLDSVKRSGVIDLDAETQNLHFILGMLDKDLRESFNIPPGMTLKGKATMKGSVYATDLHFREGTGKMSLEGKYDITRQAYSADIAIDSLNLTDFMPKDSLGYITTSLSAKGEGFDFFSPKTHASAVFDVKNFQYGKYNLSGLDLKASFAKSALIVSLDSDNPLIQVKSQLEAALHRNKVTAKLNMDVSKIDFYELGLVDKPFEVAFHFGANASSNLKNSHEMYAELTDIQLITPKKTFKPKDLQCSAKTDTMTTAILQSGDLLISLEGEGYVEKIMKQVNVFSEHLAKQLEERKIDEEELKQYLPHMELAVFIGNNNPVSNYLTMTTGLNFNDFALDISSSPVKGLLGNSYLYGLRMDSVQLDSIRFEVMQDTAGVRMEGSIINGPKNKQFVFTSTIEGKVNSNGGEVLLKYMNAKGETGVLLGVRAIIGRNGIGFHLFPDNPTVVFRPFHLNPKNYLYLNNSNHVRANIELFDDKGTGLKLYSLRDTTYVKDLALELRRIDLEEIMEVMPYMPRIGGLLSAEAHYTETEKNMQLATDIRIDSLTHEKELVGDILLSAVYLPGEAGEHYIDARLSHNDIEVMGASGLYHSTTEGGKIDADMTLEHFPLKIANAFIPDDMAELAGDIDGGLTVKGDPAKPQINGQLITDSVSVYVAMAGTRFRFEDKPIKIEDNKLTFDKYSIYTRRNNPFTIDGWVNFSDFSAMTTDLKLNATDYELISAPKTKQSLVYGKMFINFNASVRGPMDALTMRGNVNLQGNTDITYILKDSPLTVQDRLGNLVTFVNFADTTQTAPPPEQTISLGGMDMLMTVHIDPAVQLKVDLSEDRSSYIELEGGGDLSLQYTPQGDLLLSGRYTLNSGTMKYALPVLPSKTFSIQNGSYVNWSGNPMDPSLNIVALEKVRASVNDGNQPRTVSFNVTISIKNTLENLALVFNLEAPEDAAVQSELDAMSAEERGKQAVAMLATGMYLPSMGSGKSGINMGSALNSFLQSEIANIAGSALKTVDISLGVENTDGADGSSGGTDYSFRFAKRFWNNRISVIIGGKISTGESAQQQDQAFIDNISLEYRLDNTGTRYVKVFYDKNYESILEGEITEAGVGIVLRKKMARMGELFIFKKKKKTTNE